MPVTEMKPDDKKKGATCLQIVGPPYSWKTTVAGWLAKKSSVRIIGLPGERHTDILTPSENLIVNLFDPPNVSNENFDWVKQWREIREFTHKVCGTADVKPALPVTEHVVFDGAHKAFDICVNAGKQANQTKQGNVDGYRAWMWTYDEFLRWFAQGMNTPHILWRIWLAWSAREKIDPDNPTSTSKTVMPDYMGKMQQTIIGELNTIYQYVDSGKPRWQIRQTDDAKGIGIRTKPEQAENLLVKMDADWDKLKTILLA